MANDSHTPAEKQDLIGRILQSRTFSKALKRKGFLQYIFEHTLTAGEPPHERDIGSTVYGRRPDYDPSEDNIVRVEARNLRRQLEEYFRGEGAVEPILVRIPKGSYVPVFEPREQVPESTNSQSAPHPLWQLLFDSRRETLIPLADSAFAAIQDDLHLDVGLQDYLEPGFGPETSKKMRGLWLTESLTSYHRLTSFAEVSLAFEIGRLPWLGSSTTLLRFARDLHVRDFESKNVIVLGGHRANPWIRLWDDVLNFRFEYDPEAGDTFVRNRNPRRGEPSVYRREPESSLAIIAFFPKQAGDGYVLWLAGTGMVGTEAAGDFVLNDTVLLGTLEEWHAIHDGRAKAFETVIQAPSIQDVPSRIGKVLAYRVSG